MYTSFEILEPSNKMQRSSGKHSKSGFSASFVRCISFADAYLSVTMTMVDVDCDTIENKYTPIFQSIQNDQSLALGDDYEVVSKLLERLDVLKGSLKDNWNGEDDFPIEDKAYNNAKAAILETPSDMLKYWRLFPNPNGTLLLTPKSRSIAGISIGNDEFSYAAFISDDKQISGKEPFNTRSFKSALKQIHRILGYV